MRQTKKGSLLEAVTNIVVGIVVAFVVNRIVLPYYGFQISLATNAQITAWFTAVSLIRSYLLRRLFNSFRTI